MTRSNHLTVQLGLFLGLTACFVGLAGCGSNNGGSTGTSGGPPVTNTQPVAVNIGPANNALNEVFTDVTICNPGTTTCQTIPNIEVDTGSEGLRLLSSQVTLSLPAITDTSGNGLQECVSFADGSYVWGPVAAADVQLAGEKASSVPIQMISDSSSPPVPSSCASGGGPNENTVAALGANGILGIGVWQQDCGFGCTPSSTSVPPWYYLCPNSVCTTASVPLASQLQNPVWLFPQDNNGLMISLPSVPADGAQTVAGSLIFGVGTQTDNALGAAQVYTTDAYGDFQTVYNGISYSNSFIDSGSNGIFFLDSATLGILECQNYPGFYCPASTTNFTATNTGLNGTTAPVSFGIANAEALFAANNSSNVAFSNLGGNNPSSFDWGLPFFYGRKVFIGIENETGPTGTVGPYWAY